MPDKFFEYLDSLSYNKVDKSEEEGFNSTYSSFMVDTYFSLFIDTLMDANRMNFCLGRNPDLPKQVHYEYYLNKIRPRKRFSGPWPKRKKDELIETIQSYYGYSVVKARDALKVLTEEQIEQIIRKTRKGGTGK